MWLVEVVNANKQLCVSKKFCFKLRISMIKGKLSFSELQIQKVMVPNGNKDTIMFSGSVNVSMSVISTKLCFVVIS